MRDEWETCCPSTSEFYTSELNLGLLIIMGTFAFMTALLIVDCLVPWKVGAGGVMITLIGIITVFPPEL